MTYRQEHRGIKILIFRDLRDFDFRKTEENILAQKKNCTIL